MLSRFERRLCIVAVVFVAIYLGAVALTLIHRSSDRKEPQMRYETAEVKKAESRIALVQLFPPMLVLLTVTIAYMVAKKKRARQISALEESEAMMENGVQSPEAEQGPE